MRQEVNIGTLDFLLADIGQLAISPISFIDV